MSQTARDNRPRGAGSTIPESIAAALARPGPGSFRAAVAGGGYRLDVEFYRPTHFCHDSEILLVMHGTRRNAADYRDTWSGAADRYGCLVVCPRFPRVDFPRGAYQLGGIRDRTGTIRPKCSWTFEAVERLFDLVREASGNSSDGYYLYGHSAGGQFVHRLALFLPEARYVAAVAANSGWYTMPTFQERFPYGLVNAGLSPADLKRALARRLIVLLGGSDVDANDPYLRNSMRARQQGSTRRERGGAFYAAAESAAARLGVPLAWELETVPLATHSDADMMPAAARALFAAHY